MTEINTIFDGLDSREVDYVQARANAKSDAEALRMCSFSRGWLNSHDKDDLNDRAMAFKTDNVLKAQIILDQAVELAAKIKVEGMQSRNEYVKQGASTEILDRRLGKAVQKIDQKTEHSGEIDIIRVKWDDGEV
jgi:hypothetical protein